jgi:dTDP-4-dehydrorhamnose 3,5-epimerase-like enzyme
MKMGVSKILFPMYEEDNGVLCVYECGSHVPFNIQRVFTISARAGDTRGEHAHKKCSQLLICVTGNIRVWCDNGSTLSQYDLNDMGMGLIVPPGIWAKQEYTTDNAVLMVLCDRNYEVDDYIRDYNEFKIFVGL